MTTKKRNKIEELQSTLGKIEVALGAISDAIVWTDQSGRIQWCNKTFDDLVGSPHIRNLGRYLYELLPFKEHGTPLPEKGHPVNLILQQKKKIDGYYEYLRNDQKIYLQFLGRYIEMPGGNESAVMVIRNITGEKQLEQIKLQSAALYHAANAIVITDNKGAVIWVNHSFILLTGYSLQEVYGQNLSILKSGHHDTSFYRNLWNTILSGKVWHGETINRRKDGGIYVELQTIAPVLDGDGTISHYIAVKEDISERKNTERELEEYRLTLEQMVNQKTRELEKAQRELVNQALEAGISQMAAIGLHNIGNAITPIIILLEQLRFGELSSISSYLQKCYDDLKSHTTDLSQYLSKGNRGRQVLEYIGELIVSLRGQIDRQVDIWNKVESSFSYISELLTLQQSYAGGIQKFEERIDLNDMLEDAIRMQMGTLEKRRIEIKRRYTNPLPKLLIDKNRLMQVIMNIIKNSYEAISLGQLDPGDRVIEIRTFNKNERLGFEITDNGIGIDPVEIEGIFEIGKSKKGSTGFGLYYCKDFIENSNGRLLFLSQGPRKGATVRVTFDKNREHHE